MLIKFYTSGGGSAIAIAVEIEICPPTCSCTLLDQLSRSSVAQHELLLAHLQQPSSQNLCRPETLCQL
ncbi:unnamed protein product [Linum tenue]|uniref:Uncharacterized protein n=1 Tax=Linum tenue TaxID=586396 RepID=A0AAV0J315_9ROSI|nr:unnamed protein product [Linum tenue]